MGGIGLLIAVLLVAAVVAWPTLRSRSAPSSSTPVETSEDVSGASPGATSSTSPAPSGPIVEQTIVDRPGVPAALYDKYWILGSQVGRVGTTARIVMPPNEAVMGAAAGRVAAYVQDPNIYEPVVGPNGVTIVVRDFGTGKVVRTFDTQVRVTESLMTGPLLFWIGQMLPVDGPDRIDAGIWVVDLSDPASVPRTVIAPANLDATYGQRAIRGLLRLTDRGRAITTQIESDTRLVTDVIDIASLSLRATVETKSREWAFEVVDGLALVIFPPEYSSPDQPSGIRLIDIATGRQIGPTVQEDLLSGSVIGEHAVFARIGRNTVDSYIIAIDLDSGTTRNLRVVLGGNETVDLFPPLSAPDLLALTPGTGAELNDQGKIVLPVTLLDPATGNLQPDAFTIGAP